MEPRIIFMKREPIGKNCGVYVSHEYRFGTDAVLLSHFAAQRQKDTVCDLGCGSGIIPMLLCRDNPHLKIFGVDIQKEACLLSQKAADENGFSGFRALCADLRDPIAEIPPHSLSLVTCNPPYKKAGAGLKNETAERRIARHEECCTLPQVAAAAARLLKSGGRFTVCHRPERLCDLLCALREARLEPKRLRTVAQRQNAEPWLILVEARFDGKPGMRIDPTLIIEDENGALTPEMKAIYGPYKFEADENEAMQTNE